VAPFSRPPGAAALRLVGPALIITLAVGCGGGAQRPATVRPATPPSVVTSIQSPTWMLVPQVKREKFLAALSAIDRTLAANGDAALTQAVNICFKSYEEPSEETLRAYARAAYRGDAATINATAVRKIVAATMKWICPTAALHSRWES
jgi:hypothetical protein